MVWELIESTLIKEENRGMARNFSENLEHEAATQEINVIIKN